MPRRRRRRWLLQLAGCATGLGRAPIQGYARHSSSASRGMPVFSPGADRIRCSAMSSVPVLPERARVVVIGGGIIGCSVAYHLARMGWKDVVVLERDRL